MIDDGIVEVTDRAHILVTTICRLSPDFGFAKLNSFMPRVYKF